MENGKIKNHQQKTFEDLDLWQRAETLVVQTYTQFNSLQDYSFKDQICRAAVSVMNNIAEGYERQSSSEFRRFLFIAKGSAGEVRSMLSLAEKLSYISREDCATLRTGYYDMSRMIAGLIKYLK